MTREIVRRGDEVRILDSYARERVYARGKVIRGPWDNRHLICLWQYARIWVPTELLEVEAPSPNMRSRKSPAARRFRSPFEPDNLLSHEINVRGLEEGAVKAEIARIPRRTKLVIVHGRLQWDNLGGGPITMLMERVEELVNAALGPEVLVARMSDLFWPPNGARVVRNYQRVRTFDLHPVIERSPVQRAREAVMDAYRDGVVVLKLIHGKGRHNPFRKGVLRGQIHDMLSALQREELHTLRFEVDHGNEGCTCVVFD